MAVQMEIRLEPKDLEALRGFDGRWTSSARRHMFSAMEKSVAILQADAVVNAPANTGLLRNSIYTQIIGFFPNITGLVRSPLVHAPVMEYGRRAGARMPPVAALERWGWLKLGKAGLGFALAKSIQRKGIRGRKFMTRSVESNRDRIEGIFHAEIRAAVVDLYHPVRAA